jgi:fibronectin-binding autotransporter adhesin
VIRGGGIIMGDGVNTNAGTFVGGILFSNTASAFFNFRFIAFNRPDDFTFTNSILSFATDGTNAPDRGALVKIGPNVLTITGSNNFPGNTIVGKGTLMVGNGGTTGNIGGGNIVLTNNGVIVFNRSDNVTLTRAVIDDTANGNGFGSFVQIGSGVVSLNVSNSFVGSTTVSNGTLVVASAVGGDLSAYGGTLAVGGLTTPAAVFVGGILNVSAGTILFPLNKSLVQSNSLITANAGFNFTGGTLKLVNAGPALTVGDKFTLFSQPIGNGASVTIVSPGFTVANNLATDGSVMVTSIVAVTAPTLGKPILSGTNIVITATNNAGNNSGTYTLLGTNNLTAPIATWPVLKTGSFDSNGNLAITNPIVGGTNSLFYILRVP